MLTCDECRSYLDAYVYGEVSFFLKAQIEEHLASCPACLEEAAFLQQIRNTLSQMPAIEVDESFQEQLNLKIDQLEAERTPLKKKKRFYKDWRMVSALAACVLLAVVIKANVFEFGHKIEQNGSGAGIQSVSDIDLSNITPFDTPSDSFADDAEVSTGAPETVEKSAPIAEQTAKPSPSVAPKASAQPTDIPKEQDGGAGKNTAAPTKTESVHTEPPVVSSRMKTVPDAKTAEQTESAQEDVSKTNVPEERAANDLKSGGGSAGGADSASSPAVAAYNMDAAESKGTGTLYVDSESISKAKNIADGYGKRSGSTVEMSKEQLNQYLNALSENGVEYNAAISSGDTVSFDIEEN